MKSNRAKTDQPIVQDMKPTIGYLRTELYSQTEVFQKNFWVDSKITKESEL